jgi:hypothetical protein
VLPSSLIRRQSRDHIAKTYDSLLAGELVEPIFAFNTPDKKADSGEATKDG